MTAPTRGARSRLFRGRPSLGHVSYLGEIRDTNELGKVYVASDVLAFPGAIGLGPLQALCLDIPVVGIHSNVHKPEVAYLNTDNSLLLPEATSPTEYAMAIHELFETEDLLVRLKRNAWQSIKHLTIESMADNFILGVNFLLDIPAGCQTTPRSTR